MALSSAMILSSGIVLLRRGLGVNLCVILLVRPALSSSRLTNYHERVSVYTSLVYLEDTPEQEKKSLDEKFGEPTFDDVKISVPKAIKDFQKGHVIYSEVIWCFEGGLVSQWFL